MNLIIKGKQFEVTDSIENYIRKKMMKLEKYFDQIIEAVATVSVQKNRHIFEVTLQAKRAIIRAEEESVDIYNCVDRVVERLERQIIKYKEKLYSKYSTEYNKNKAVEISKIEDLEISSPTEQNKTIVKTKRFALKPMSPEEASLQMDLLGHNFFVFSNEESGQINVIYKRKDGNFGLIEPEI